MGVIPSNSLVTMLHSGHSNSELINHISELLQRDIITLFAKLFTSICLVTSFLGVSIGLSDFLADGFKISKQQGNGKIIVSILTFAPPLIIVLFYPNIFIKALNYAGICCVILLLLLPSLMVWSGRYRKTHLAKGYQVIGGKLLLSSLILIALFLIGQGITESVKL
jgi:tyrosine-specific transport protein